MLRGYGVCRLKECVNMTKKNNRSRAADIDKFIKVCLDSGAKNIIWLKTMMSNLSCFFIAS